MLPFLTLGTLVATVLAGAFISTNSRSQPGNTAVSEKQNSSRIAVTKMLARADKAENSNNIPLTGTVTISPEVISGGGGSSSGGAFTLDDTLGETSAAERQSGGNFTFDGGFWNMPQDFSNPTSTDTPTGVPTASPTATPMQACIANMISWWPGEENALDIVSQNDGTLQQGATFAQGEVGRAFSFDGVDDDVLVGNPPSLNVTSATIEAWVNTNSFPNGTITNVVAKWGFDATVDSYLLGLINNGGVIQVFGAIGDGVTGDPGVSGGSVSTNTWIHIAMTYDAVSGANRLYLNGVQVASRTRNGGIFQTATNVYIGREDSAQGRFFNGLIDEPSIYSRALSGAEIQAIYNAGAAGKCNVIPTATPTNTPTATSTPTPPTCAAPAPNMVSWWRSENNALDMIGGNNGTLQNGAGFAVGEVGQAFNLDGIDDYVAVPYAANLDFGPMTPLSVDFWALQTSAASTQHMIGERLGCFPGNLTWQVSEDATGGLTFGTVGNFVTTGSSLQLNTWTHVAGTFDGATLRIYVNGTLAGTLTGTLGPNINAPLSIGTAGTCQSFGGKIDEVEIFNRALSQIEIQSIYNAANAGTCSAPTPTATPTVTPTGTPGGSAISGTITYGNAVGNPPPPRLVRNVTVQSTSGSPMVGPVITGTPGTYTLTGFGATSYTIKPTKPGGANTAITSADAARVAQGVSGSVPFVSQNQRFAADTTGNGGPNPVSSQDAAFIARFAAGLTGFGRTGTWFFFVTGAPSPMPTAPATYNDSRTYAAGFTGNMTGQDYVALLVGEVTGNYNPANNARPAIGPESTTVVALPQITVDAGKEVVVPIRVDGAVDKNITSYEFDLRYDPSVIQPLADPVDVVKTASRGLSFATNPYQPGLLRVVMYGAYPIDSDGILLNLRFTAIGDAGTASPLTFERIMFNEGDPRGMVTNGRIELF
jgi:hypothetical protein